MRKNEQRILVTGYNAENELAYLGNYFGTPTKFVKVLEAVKERNAHTVYAEGACLSLKKMSV